MGATALKQGQIKPNTVQSYLTALKSYYIDRKLPTTGFTSLCIDCILAGAHFLFPHVKRKCLSIIKNIFEKITILLSCLLVKVNIDAAFKVAWAGFLCIRKFTYTKRKAQSSTFINTSLTCSDIIFSDGNQHAILRLKKSKTDVHYTGVEIILAATYSQTCPVTALQKLYTNNPQLCSALLFQQTGKSTAFTKKYVLENLQSKLLSQNVPTPKLYIGHSFQKNAAQHASDNGMLNQHIQKLGR